MDARNLSSFLCHWLQNCLLLSRVSYTDLNNIILCQFSRINPTFHFLYASKFSLPREGHVNQFPPMYLTVLGPHSLLIVTFFFEILSLTISRGDRNLLVSHRIYHYYYFYLLYPQIGADPLDYHISCQHLNRRCDDNVGMSPINWYKMLFYRLLILYLYHKHDSTFCVTFKKGYFPLGRKNMNFKRCIPMSKLTRNSKNTY